LELCNKIINKDPTSPQMCCYTTLCMTMKQIHTVCIADTFLIQPLPWTRLRIMSCCKGQTVVGMKLQ